MQMNFYRRAGSKYISPEFFILCGAVGIVIVSCSGSMMWQNRATERARMHQMAGIAIVPEAISPSLSPSVSETPFPSDTLVPSPSPSGTPSPKATKTPMMSGLKQSALVTVSPSPISSSSPSPSIANFHSCSLADADVEREIFASVNSERGKKNMKALVWDDAMAQSARGHSLDMAENNFFSHINLKGEAPWDRAVHYHTSVTGENIGKWGEFMDQLSGIVDGTVSMWMASKGHRDNILGAYSHTGVGVVCSTNGYYLTQVFR